MELISNQLFNYSALVDNQAALNDYKIAWWLPMPNTVGGVFLYDLMGLSDGTLNISSSGGWVSTFRDGGFMSLSLNGNGEFISIPDTTSFQFGSTDFTISGWFKLNTLNNSNANGRQIIISRFESSGGKGFTLGINTSGSLIFELSSDLSTFTSFSTSTGTISINTWYHFVAVRQGLFVYVYLNGKLVASGTTPSLYVLSSGVNQNILLGDSIDNSSQHYYVSGCIDDICIYKSAMSQSFAYRIYEESRMSYPTTLRRIRIGRAMPLSSPWVYYTIMQNTYGVSL